MIQITDTISIDETEIDEQFIHGSGPGGQNVNKVATVVQLRFDIVHVHGFTMAAKARLRRLAGRRLTGDGVIVIEASRFRAQERNREDARERLFGLIREASIPPKPRIKTKPSRAASRRRLDSKKKRSGTKKNRQNVPPE
jgi:ribosome-associated protein